MCVVLCVLLSCGFLFSLGKMDVRRKLLPRWDASVLAMENSEDHWYSGFMIFWQLLKAPYFPPATREDGPAVSSLLEQAGVEGTLYLQTQYTLLKSTFILAVICNCVLLPVPSRCPHYDRTRYIDTPDHTWPHSDSISSH